MVNTDDMTPEQLRDYYREIGNRKIQEMSEEERQKALQKMVVSDSFRNLLRGLLRGLFRSLLGY